MNQLHRVQHLFVKSIQKFHIRTRSDIYDSMVGLNPIYAEIDKRKLLFLGKLCTMPVETLTKSIFRRRIFDFIHRNESGRPCFSFIADKYNILQKYDLTEILTEFVNNVEFPNKSM